MGEEAGGIRVATAVANVVGHPDTPRNLIAAISSGLAGQHADLCILFGSAHFESEIEKVVEALSQELRPRAFLGASGEAVIADGLEYEHQPALVLWAARMPRVQLASFHFSDGEELERASGDAELREHLGPPRDSNVQFLLAGDPFSFGKHIVGFLDRLASAYPDRPALGGFASAAEKAGENFLVFDGEVLRHGLTGVAMWGDVSLESVVSQGCRPIGRHFVITKAEQNLIHKLGGRPAVEVLTEVLNACSAHDRELVKRRGLLVGRVINEYQANFGRGDFLIRNPMGIDSNTGALAVDEYVRPGQTIQLHVRDSESADEDLRTLLSPRRDGVAGALVFSCNGRGTRLFADRNHDARMVSEAVAAAPSAGMFCAGEIGPVGTRNYLHGHTAAIGIIRGT